MTVYFEHADGYSTELKAEGLNYTEAVAMVENEAVCAHENCAEEDVGNIFPMYWSIRGCEAPDGPTAGYVDEHGEIYSE